MARMPKTCTCECGRKAKLGLPHGNLQSFVRGAAINDKTKDQFRWTFGKKKSRALRTTKDIDARFTDFAGRYPHLQPGYKRGKKYDPRSAADMAQIGRPGDIARDPFPREKITDDVRMYSERRAR